MYFFVFLLAEVFGGLCPVYQCSLVPDLVCAEWIRGEVFLSQQACREGLHCSLHELQESVSGAPWGELQCVEKRGSIHQVFTNTKDCRHKDEDARLLFGSHPKRCASVGGQDYACKLKNGKVAPCKCGLDGRAYCDLSDGDPEMNLFWEWCEASEVPEAVSSFWELYTTYFTETLVTCTQTAPDCAFQLLDELSDLHSTRYAATLRPSRSNSALAVSGGLVLGLLLA